jgi:hypothetical protein
MRKGPRPSASRSEVQSALLQARENKGIANLSGLRLAGVDLSRTDFTGAVYDGLFSTRMLGVDCRNTNLRGCNLQGVDLASANLRGSDLSGATLAGANLYTSLLEGARLGQANLSGANLVSAELVEVELQDTKFAEARFGKTSIADVDLSRALDLDRAVHISSSPVDYPTLRRTALELASAGQIRQREVFRFLANAGFEEDVLSVMRSWIGRPIEFYSTFLSHSSLDKDFARKLYEDLRALGVRVWFDEHEIMPGDDILRAVDKGVKLWDKLVLVCSRHSLDIRTGWWVKQELERALRKEREMRATGVEYYAFIPLSIDGYLFDSYDGPLRETILERSVGDFRDWQDSGQYARALDRLVVAINRDRATG